MQMNTEESRRQFEVWVVTQNVFKKYNAHLRKNVDGSYKDYRVNDRWNAWQASRANMPKIKLPGVNFSSTFYGDIESRVINKCKQAIHEAGYEVE